MFFSLESGICSENTGIGNRNQILLCQQLASVNSPSGNTSVKREQTAPLKYYRHFNRFTVWRSSRGVVWTPVVSQYGEQRKRHRYTEETGRKNRENWREKLLYTFL